MIKVVHVKGVSDVRHQFTKAAQESARHCQKFSAAFKAVVSVTLLRRRAINRLERVRGHAAALAVNILNWTRVNQVLSMQTAAWGSRPYELSHYWLHGSSPYNP